MTNSIFNKAVFISFLGHIAVFVIFSFSFGPKIPKANFAEVSFFGAILRNLDFSSPLHARPMLKKADTLALDKANPGSPLLSGGYLKPPVALSLNREKQAFMQKAAMPGWVPPKRSEPAIMFYPKLPYHFALYFKDREAVHLELSFQVISTGRRNSVVVKRKISSGNLEADLLSARYIGRYLVQQAGEVTDKWQTVKIDLSAREE